MRVRALVFDDDEDIRALLAGILEQRGYEVFSFSDPGSCPLYHQESCACHLSSACSDIIISDIEMPVARGIEMVVQQLRKGCKCPHIALMSGSWNEEDLRTAQDLGCKVFHKPFTLSEIGTWLDHCEQLVRPNRHLDWPIGAPPG